MTPEAQAAREIGEWYHAESDDVDDTRVEELQRKIAVALRERDEQWKHTLAEMEACYLKREGDIRSRIEQARQEEREFYVKIIKRPAIWDMLHRHEIAAIRARAQEGK